MADIMEFDKTDISHSGIHVNIIKKLQVKNTFPEYFNHNILIDVLLWRHNI